MVKNNNISVLGKDYKNQVGEYALRNNNVTCKDIVVDLSNKFDSINLCFFSDTHLGSSDADIKGILQNLDYIDKYGINLILKNYINITNNNGNLIICGIEKLFTYTNSITNNLYQVHDEDKVFELINI